MYICDDAMELCLIGIHKVISNNYRSCSVMRKFICGHLAMMRGQHCCEKCEFINLVELKYVNIHLNGNGSEQNEGQMRIWHPIVLVILTFVRSMDVSVYHSIFFTYFEVFCILRYQQFDAPLSNKLSIKCAFKHTYIELLRFCFSNITFQIFLHKAT